MRDKRHSLILLIFLFLGITLFFLFRGGGYDGQARLTLVVGGKSTLAIFSIEPQQKRAVYLLIPPNTYLNVPYGYQNYLAGSIYILGELDDKRSGGKLLSKSIENTAGIAVNGYFIGGGDVFPFITDQKEQLIKALRNPLNWFNIGGRVDTNLTFLDQFKLWWAARGLRGDQIKFLDMERSLLLKDEVLPDKSLVKKINIDQFELEYGGEFEDSWIRRENVTLEVVNATDREFVASNFGRILEHLGATVVVLSSAKEKRSTACTVYLEKKEFEKKRIVVILNKLYNCRIEVGEDDTFKSDAKILLGEDFLK